MNGLNSSEYLGNDCRLQKEPRQKEKGHYLLQHVPNSSRTERDFLQQRCMLLCYSAVSVSHSEKDAVNVDAVQSKQYDLSIGTDLLALVHAMQR